MSLAHEKARPARGAAFGIERSLNKARWVMAEDSLSDVQDIMRMQKMPELVAKLLSSRGIQGDAVEPFIDPKLARDFPDPFSMQGMRDFADDIATEIEKSTKFAVFGDFDVDGSTSSAVFVRFFRALGFEIPFYIPDRMAEGYGPNINALKSLQDQGAEYVFIADCGTTSFDVIAAGREMGLKIVIFDHHEPEDKLPVANHVINPKRHDDESGLDVLAAVGVCYLSCVAINNVLKARGYYDAKGLKAPDMRNMLDLVALGTVCDMVPLTGANRLFVRYGLPMIERQSNIGIKALSEVAGVSGTVDSYTCGFMLGPRINAGSRVHKAYLGAEMLSSEDAEHAKNIAWTLNDCNDKRKAIQTEMIERAKRKVEAEGLDQHPLLFIDDEKGHPGLSGLVAGQVKELYNKPCIVVTYADGEDGRREGRGSGRSVAGVNMATAFIDARHAGHVLKGGGHAMAGGFTLLPEQVEGLQAFLNEHVAKQLESAEPMVDTEIDGVISVRGVQVGLARDIERFVGPYGMANEEPLFVLPNVKLQMVDVVGGAHVKCMIVDAEGGSRIKAIAFRAADTEMGEVMLKKQGAPMHVVGFIRINSWNGNETAELHIKDVALLQG
jgi:single-stranded-DNA-specific exonuclease